MPIIFWQLPLPQGTFTMLCEASSGKHKTTSCRRAATVRVSLANQATVLVPGCRSQSALGGSSVAAGHIAWASALAGALGTAEVARNAADANGDLIGLAATRRVAIMGGVGRHGHLPHSKKTCCQHSLLWALQRSYILGLQGFSNILQPLQARLGHHGRKGLHG